MKYTRQDLKRDFPNDDACLEWLKDWLYPDGITCKGCEKITPHHKIRGRKVYSCDYCGSHTSPTANTIFHKSSTSLVIWFEAIFLMAQTRAGISAKQLERETGVTYKTAWRMFHQIRAMMGDDGGAFSGEVEVDETYIGRDPLKRRSTGKPRDSQVVFGMVERGGRARAKHVQSSGSRSLIPEIEKKVAKGTTIYSDEWVAYKNLGKHDYSHSTIQHGKGNYVRGNVHTQNVENLWSNMKRGVRGVYRHVSEQHLQAYVDEYAFRYSHRNDFQPMFWAIMNRIPSDSSARKQGA